GDRGCTTRSSHTDKSSFAVNRHRGDAAHSTGSCRSLPTCNRQQGPPPAPVGASAPVIAAPVLPPASSWLLRCGRNRNRPRSAHRQTEWTGRATMLPHPPVEAGGYRQRSPREGAPIPCVVVRER